MRQNGSPRLLLLLAAAGGVTLACRPASNADAPPIVASAPTAVGALGRIEPGDGVVRLAARSLSGQPSIVARLLVAERDVVQAGQLLAELDSADQLLATLSLAEARVDVSRKRIEQIQAGAKPSDIAAQRAEIARLAAELEDAERDRRRYQDLRERDSVSEAALNAANLRVETASILRQQADERLVSLSSVRPVDVDVAKAELDAAIREVALWRTQHAASQIRAPLTGQVVRIHAWPGEEVGPDGVMELANTDQMYVLAEIAEGDMARVREGQRATITGFGLPQPLTGVVQTVALVVTQASVLKLDPAAFSDARVAEAKIRLDDGEQVAHLIHLRVNVAIDVMSPAADRREGR